MTATSEGMAPRDWTVALACLVGAAALRIPGAVTHAFDQDELYTYFESRDLFATTLEPGIEARPLYYLLQHPLLDVLPMTEFGLRVLPLVFGLAGVLSTWWIAHKLAGSVAGLIAGATVAVAPWHIYVSQTARYWSLVYLLSAWLIWYLWRLLESGPRSRGAHGIAVLLLSMGVATHPTFLFPAVGAMAAVVLAVRSRSTRFRQAVRNLVLRVALPFTGLMLIAFTTLTLVGREGAVRNFDGRGLTAVLRLTPAIVEWLTPLMFGAALVASVALLLQSKDKGFSTFGLLSLGAILGSMGILAVAALVTDVYAYYATAMLPLVFLSIGVAAAVLVGLFDARSSRMIGVGLASILVAGTSPGTASQVLDGTRFDYRPAFEHLQALDTDELVLSWPVVVQRHYAPDLRADEFRPDPGYLSTILEAESQVWMVVSRRRYGIVGDQSGEARAWLSRHCQEAEAFLPTRFDFRMYEVQLHRCSNATDDGSTVEGRLL